MMTRQTLSLIAAGFALLIGGCSSQATTPPVGQSHGESAFLLTSEPEGAVDIGEARTSLEDAQNVVLVGRIGGSEKPFVDGLAAFTIVDLDVPYCSEEEGCATPWDYCCHQNQVKENIATVKIVDDEGQPIMEGARELLGVKELSTVVVDGTAHRDADGNLSIAARKVFVRQ